MRSQIKYRLSTVIRKNRDDLLSICRFKYPNFIYRSLSAISDWQIPIFVFHSVKPQTFERAIAYLANNDYKTLTAEELYVSTIDGSRFPSKSVCLTFDDGRGSIWATAFPILKKYNLKAICFLVALRIKDDSEVNPTLEDYWNGKADINLIEEREKAMPLCTWSEIRTMHESGIFDFQSHTSYHHTVYTDNQLIDFVNPQFFPSFPIGDFNPVIIKNGKDTFEECHEFGLPVYTYRPSMISNTRYLEPEELNYVCVQWVKRNGGVDLFKSKHWRREMYQFYCSLAPKYEKQTQQNISQRYQEVYDDLSQSKIEIELRLKKQVTHLCFPWYVGNSLAVLAAKNSGYKAIHWGIMDGQTINNIGQDPYKFCRINEEYILTLPGYGRVSLAKVLFNKIFDVYKKK